MSYKEFADRLDAQDRAWIKPSEHNDEVGGIQSEFEERMESHLANGVIEGMLCAVNDPNIDIAAGDAYCEGKRYDGGVSIDFTGLANNTYYIFIDPTDDTDPYKAQLAAPAATELTLGVVDWATPNLTNLVDLREWGIIPKQFECDVVGAVAVDQIGFFTVPRGVSFWIDGVSIWAVNNGTGAGPTLVDVHAGASGGVPATIFTTQGYRPSMAHDAVDCTLVYNTGYPEANRLLAAGSIIIVEVDAAATALADLSVCVFGRWVR